MKLSKIMNILMIVCSACTMPLSDKQITSEDSFRIATATKTFDNHSSVFITETPSINYDNFSLEETSKGNTDAVVPTETEEELKCFDLEGWGVEKIDASIDCWETIIVQNPENFYGLYGLSRLYGVSGRTQESIYKGFAALNYAPNTDYKSRIFLNVGLNYMFLKDYTNSINYLQEAMKIGNPENKDIIVGYSFLAEIYNQQNQKEKACENFKKYIELGTKIKDESIMNMKEYESIYCR